MEKKLEKENNINSNSNNINNQKEIKQEQFKVSPKKKFDNKNNESSINDHSPQKSDKKSPKHSDKSDKKYIENNDKVFGKYNKSKIPDTENYLSSETREKINTKNSKKFSGSDKEISPNFLMENPVNINDLNNLKNDLQNNLKNFHILKKNKFDDNYSDINTESYKNSNSKVIKNKEKEKEKSNIDYSKIYEKYKIFARKHVVFYILFIIGIVFNLVSHVSSLYLQLYGNSEAFIYSSGVSFLIVIFYSLGIAAIRLYRKFIYSIIKNKDDPEKIFQSRQRKNIFIFIYALLLSFNYQLIIFCENTVFINNIKMSIRGRGYDELLWINYFQNKNYSEIIKSFEKIHTGYLIFSWLSIILTIFIILYIFYFIKSYRSYKFLIQILCIILIISSLLQIYYGKYCQNLIKITSLDEKTFSWVTPGEIVNGVIGFCLGIYGIYIFFTENKKQVLIFNFICLGLFILSIIFSYGMRRLDGKFTSYKMTSCNSLFKFISEESLVSKYKECSNKYLFTTESLESIQCPKERIMINWELTENNENNIENYIKLGCIDQSCCLRTYFNIKLKFNYLEMISFYQIVQVIILLTFGIYMYCNMDTENALEEEILDKIGQWILIIFCILVFITVLIMFFFQKSYPKQSELNKIKNNKVNDYLTEIDRNLVVTEEKNKLIGTIKEVFDKKKKEIINNYDYNVYLDLDDNNSNFDLLYFDYYLYSDCVNILYKDDLSKNVNYLNYSNITFSNKTQIVNFKSKNNIVNKLLNYFDYDVINPIKPINNLVITINIFFQKKDSTKKLEKNKIKKFRILNDVTNNILTITNDNISSGYNENTGLSKISLLKNIQLNFSIIDKNYPFYIIGNILNDEGNSLINIYNYYFGKENFLYSVKSNNNGSFIIGPLYPLSTSEIFELNIEIYKIKKNLNDTSNYERDDSYHLYNEIIKISSVDYFGYYSSFHRIKNVLLPIKITNKNYGINGNVYEKKSNDYLPLSNVNVKIYQGDYTYLMNEILENIKNGKNDDYSLSRTISDKDGNFILNVNNNGYYFLIYEKNNYFIETQTIIINETSGNNININKMELIKLFNDGRIIVKLEWESKPNDLDLICRFKVSEKDYCYTFFGNQKCVETYFYKDAKNQESYSEIIEIEEFSDYIYLFYVRKFFDESNGEAKNERKIEGVDMGKNLNFTDLYKNNDELLINSKAKLLIYNNGLKYPMIKIDINDYLNENLNIENSYKEEDNKDIYWIGFCINGKEGLNAIKIINKISKNEPDKNICSNYYSKANKIDNL